MARVSAGPSWLAGRALFPGPRSSEDGPHRCSPGPDGLPARCRAGFGCPNRAEPPSADTPFRPYVPVSSVSDSNTSLREVAGSAPRRMPGGPGTRLTRRLLWDPVPCAPASRQLHEVGACGSSDDTRNVTAQTPAPGAHGPARTRHQGSEEGRLQPGPRRPRKWKRTESSWDGGGGLLQANGGGGLPPGARGSAARCRRLCCVALATVLRDMGLLWPHPRVMCPVFTPRLEEPLGDSSSTPRKPAAHSAVDKGSASAS